MGKYYCISFLLLVVIFVQDIKVSTAIQCGRKVFDLEIDDRPDLHDWQDVNKHPLYYQNDLCPLAVKKAIEDGLVTLPGISDISDMKYDQINGHVFKYREEADGAILQTTGLLCWDSPFIVLHHMTGTTTEEVLVNTC